MRLVLDVQKTKITVISTPVITSGMVGIPVSLTYDDVWDALTKVVFFKADDMVRQATGAGYASEIPWELLRKAGAHLYVGVKGVDSDGSVVIPTTWCKVCIIAEGASGDVPAAPAPGVDVPTGGSDIDDTGITRHTTWSSLNIVNKLCPVHEDKDVLLSTFTPVEGYPLTIRALEGGEDPGVTVTVCGKNLYDAATYPCNIVGYVVRTSGGVTASGNYRRTDYIPVGHMAGKTITLNKAPVSANNPGMAFYSRLPSNEDDTKSAYISGGSGYNTPVPANAQYMRFSVLADDVDALQVEIGSVATEYEEYSGISATNNNDASGEYIGFGGFFGSGKTTHVYAYRPMDGDRVATTVNVSTRLDTATVIEQLTNAILSLGDNI